MINIKIQALLTLSLPTSIYAFYKIKKLRLGILVLVLSSMLSISSMTDLIILTHIKSFGLYFIASIFIFSFSYILPIIYITKWTKQYNRNLLKEIKSNNSQ